MCGTQLASDVHAKTLNINIVRQNHAKIQLHKEAGITELNKQSKKKPDSNTELVVM